VYLVYGRKTPQSNDALDITFSDTLSTEK
jgi:hypothetical protein